MATKYKTQVRLTCPDYMLFQDRKFQRNITCLENGFWNETDLACTGGKQYMGGRRIIIMIIIIKFIIIIVI